MAMRAKKHTLGATAKEVCSKEYYLDGFGRKVWCDRRQACASMMTGTNIAHTYHDRCKENCPDCAKIIEEQKTMRTLSNATTPTTPTKNDNSIAATQGHMTMSTGEIAATCTALFSVLAMAVFIGFFLFGKRRKKRKNRQTSSGYSSARWLQREMIETPSGSQLTNVIVDQTVPAVLSLNLPSLPQASVDQTANTVTDWNLPTPTTASDDATPIPASNRDATAQPNVTDHLLPSNDSQVNDATGNRPVQVHDGDNPPKDAFGDDSFQDV